MSPHETHWKCAKHRLRMLCSRSLFFFTFVSHPFPLCSPRSHNNIESSPWWFDKAKINSNGNQKQLKINLFGFCFVNVNTMFLELSLNSVTFSFEGKVCLTSNETSLITSLLSCFEKKKSEFEGPKASPTESWTKEKLTYLLGTVVIVANTHMLTLNTTWQCLLL